MTADQALIALHQARETRLKIWRQVLAARLEKAPLRKCSSTRTLRSSRLNGTSITPRPTK